MVRPFLQEGAKGKYWYGWEEGDILLVPLRP